MKTKIILSLLTLGVLFLAKPNQTLANEGQFYLRSNLNNDSECLAFSVEVKTNEYQILITCRGLIYPPLPPDSDSYILWADGADTKNPVKLTNLQFGKGMAKKNNKFNRLFVTLERGSPKEPTGRTIMSANLSPYEFDRTTTANSPTQSPISTAVTPETISSPTPTPASTRQPFWQTNLGKLIIIITGGFIIFVLILMVYGKRK